MDTKEGREGFSGKGLTCGQGGGSRAYQFRRQIGRLVPHLGGQAEGVVVNMQAVCHLLAHLEHKRFGSRVAVKDLLQGSVDAGKAISPLLGPLVGSGFGVKCEDAQRREQEFGQVFVPQRAVLPQTLSPLSDNLKHQLDRPQCHLPAHKKAEVPAHMDILGREGQSLDVEYGVELRKQALHQLLVGLSVPGTGSDIDLIERKVAKQLEDDVVDIAA